MTSEHHSEAAASVGEAILAEAHREIDRADQKASILLAGVGVAIGAILAGLIPAHWSPSDLGSPWQWIWWAGILATSVGIAFLLAAVYPRIGGKGNGKQLNYFGDACEMPTREAVRECLIETSKDELGRTVDQIFVDSRIVKRKYRLI
jgi:MFS family permease